MQNAQTEMEHTTVHAMMVIKAMASTVQVGSLKISNKQIKLNRQNISKYIKSLILRFLKMAHTTVIRKFEKKQNINKKQ